MQAGTSSQGALDTSMLSDITALDILRLQAMDSPPRGLVLVIGSLGVLIGLAQTSSLTGPAARRCCTLSQQSRLQDGEADRAHGRRRAGSSLACGSACAALSPQMSPRRRGSACSPRSKPTSVD